MSDLKPEPQVGSKFYVLSEDEGEADEEREIDEVMESPDPDDPDGVYNVASGGDFFDIRWDEDRKRWEEDI